MAGAAVGDAGQSVPVGQLLQLFVQGFQLGGPLGDFLFQGVGVVLYLGVEAGVFDGDGGLRGQQFDQLHSGFGEDAVGQVVFHIDRRFKALPQNRHAEYGAGAEVDGVGVVDEGAC